MSTTCARSARAPDGFTSRDTTVDFDHLWRNRLYTVKEVKGVAQQWSQDFEYDRYGNRWQMINGNPSLSFSVVTNKITTGGYSYDLAGNLTDDTHHTYTYDAENHIKTVDGAVAYVYDGEGQRVRKLLGESVRMVYGITGELIAEYEGTSGDLKKEYIYGANGLAATIAAGEGTRYTTADHLGSPRIITNGSGAVISRHDYQPFGEELFVGMGSRTSAQGYGSQTDSLRQKFTGKERDNETGLDYFGARYYANITGRFTSCDPIILTQEHFVNPQRLNLYVYVNNNPLALIDPDGRDPQGQGGGRVIDIYITHRPSERGMTGRGGTKYKGQNWRGLQKNAPKGTTVNVYYSTDTSVGDSEPTAAKIKLASTTEPMNH